MIVRIVKIANLSYEKVQFYSLKREGTPYSEYRDFLVRMQQKPEIIEDLQLLNNYIGLIGRKYGADKKHFKAEGDAERLPPPYHFVQGDYGVRLYCIIATTDIVIHLNGDHKTAEKAQDCPNCFPHFRFANKAAKVFKTAVESGFIEFEDKEIIYTNDDFELDIE